VLRALNFKLFKVWGFLKGHICMHVDKSFWEILVSRLKVKQMLMFITFSLC